MSLIVKILLFLVVLHLVAGFGWALYKIEFGGKKKNAHKEPDSETES
ncbi:MAG: hypothetical protein GXO24_04760 [Chlorobi bacterium]|nr:hypothetical protein [Chlorobiota bacterium]